jgi:hypothetical protein
MNVDEWVASVGKLSSIKKAKKEVVASALTGWLGTDIPDYTEGRWEAVCRRTTWLFPDGWGFSVGYGFKPVITHMTEKLSKDDGFPMPKYFNKSEWEFFPHINGYCWVASVESVPDGKVLADLVDAFAVKHGKPGIIIPWSNPYAEMIVDQAEDYFEWHGEDLAEGKVNLHKIMFDLANIVTDVDVLNSKSPWNVVLGDEMEGLSEYSDFARFENFISMLEDNNVAILDLDQHCAARSSGTEEWAIKENPLLEGKPVFRTWGQNSQESWFGDGTIAWIEAWIEDAADEKRIKFYAEEAGLHTGIYEEDWEPTGDFEYSSPTGTLL